MAFDNATRNRLSRFVSEARGVLIEEFQRQLQGDYGMTPKTGEVADLKRLKHLDDAKLETARVLRDILAHYLATSPDTGQKARKAAIERIAREQAFTVLNRICAFRMMEARGIIRPAVSQGYESQAFQLFQRVAGSALGDTGQTYQAFLASLCDEFAGELKLLFDRFTAEGRLFPREPALLEVLELVNHAELEQLWAEDETIGWIYQYFNSADERKAMRKASGAPRNSRELAVRNQFFTPRYVVEFLVDNTLARMWWEATGGTTELYDRCQYLLVKPDEKAEPKDKLRDPRTIKLLDPACGSMHFGLYAFDLFEVIYREAWAWQQQHGPDSLDQRVRRRGEQQRGEKTELLEHLAEKYEDEAALARDIPRLIIEHNIHGVDIDPRAAQIATLALWLRAQRSWHDAGVSAGDRPAIGRSNLLAAVAPPAEPELREQFAKKLDRQDAELFEQTLQMLKGLPELGVLLKAEEELPALVRKVFSGKGDDLFAEEEQAIWQQAEERLRNALDEFAREATSTHQGRLFAQDALEGLRLVDIVDEVFDVVVMNPPFGEPTVSTGKAITQGYPNWCRNLLCALWERATEIAGSRAFIGAIFDRTAIVKSSYENYRRNVLLNSELECFLDLGWGVLDQANVETCVAVMRNSACSNDSTFQAIDARDAKSKEESARISPRSIVRQHPLRRLPNAVLGYDLPPFMAQLLESRPSLSESGAKAHPGLQVKMDRFVRCHWETPSKQQGFGEYRPLYNGGTFCRYYMPILDVVKWDHDAKEIRSHVSTRWNNSHRYFSQGIGYGKRGDNVDAHVLPAGTLFTIEGLAVFPDEASNLTSCLGLMNAPIVSQMLGYISGQHKHAGYVDCLPTPDWEALSSAGQFAITQYEERRYIDSCFEISPYFVAPWPWQGGQPRDISEIEEAFKELFAKSINTPMELERLVEHAYFPQGSATTSGINISGFCSDDPASPYQTEIFDQKDPSVISLNLLSFFVGLAFSRWALISENSDILQLAGGEPFSPLPDRPPALKPSGEITKTVLSHTELAQLCFQMIDRVFGDPGAAEEQLLHRLKTEDLGAAIALKFFNHHYRVYSKSRKAPIYWPISTVSGDYTLWIYYPTLNSQTLYTAVNDFVDPKLKEVAVELTSLRQKGAERSSADEERFGELGDFESELQDFRTTLLEIAELFRPNQDDGVQITAAPLWPLFRHKPWQKVLKRTWEELTEGKYDWAHLTMAYWPERVVRSAHADRSIAIAHDLEDDLWHEVETESKRGKAKTEWQPKELTESELDHIAKRFS